MTGLLASFRTLAAVPRRRVGLRGRHDDRRYARPVTRGRPFRESAGPGSAVRPQLAPVRAHGGGTNAISLLQRITVIHHLSPLRRACGSVNAIPPLTSTTAIEPRTDSRRCPSESRSTIPWSHDQTAHRHEPKLSAEAPDRAGTDPRCDPNNNPARNYQLHDLISQMFICSLVLSPAVSAANEWSCCCGPSERGVPEGEKGLITGLRCIRALLHNRRRSARRGWEELGVALRAEEGEEGERARLQRGSGKETSLNTGSRACEPHLSTPDSSREERSRKT
ncbi:hypothetical protein SKAU_G00108580 [Synaphobranchus kaupii]|uniref:Uncharacterized protein n=1 Tax=Synaphobranchus kaupii TaxID=118154 RepID=A0A9Q1J5Z5_SYNKA|nr:hypothetical protein SKAU_G00108580 [Synaphobranchus kaupii]